MKISVKATVLFSLVALAVMAPTGCYPIAAPPPVSTSAPPPVAPSPAPAVVASIGNRSPDFTLNSVDGNPVTFSSYRGKPAILYFWTMTCSGCREKMAVIQQAWDKISPGTIAMLCIHVEGRASLIKGYAASTRLTVPILLDVDGKVAERYGVTGIPTSFFIDSDGIVRLIDANFDTAEELIGIFQAWK